MTRDEVIRDLNAIGPRTFNGNEYWDREIAHVEADEFILKFLEDNGYADVAEAWKGVADRCGGFWYA